MVDGFVLRYRTDLENSADQLPGDEGAFLACSFWMANALLSIGRQDEARELFERARGGLLYVTDADVLTRDFTGGRGVGQDVVDTLLALMDEHRGEVVVIVSGRPREMSGFLSGNPELASRFSGTVEFTPYSREELVGVFVVMAERADLRVPEATRRALAEMVGADDGRFTEENGHRVRALFEASVTRQARRIEAAAQAGDSPDVVELQTLLPEDLPERGVGGGAP
jgi:hypothetical protein